MNTLSDGPAQAAGSLITEKEGVMSIAPPFSETVVLSVGKVTLSLTREHQEALEAHCDTRTFREAGL